MPLRSYKGDASAEKLIDRAPFARRSTQILAQKLVHHMDDRTTFTIFGTSRGVAHKTSTEWRKTPNLRERHGAVDEEKGGHSKGYIEQV